MIPFGLDLARIKQRGIESICHGAGIQPTWAAPRVPRGPDASRAFRSARFLTKSSTSRHEKTRSATPYKASRIYHRIITSPDKKCTPLN